ncbi:HMG domain-containing protein 3 [Nematostella vectensis]|uniref:HMG domain-containing protein 3 n=1 Tax=Nematostella vectensis TaxID=45351 RepID=UPI002077006E|nr:HMG domain-containing protein 3 [Nematostella vectensis]
MEEAPSQQEMQASASGVLVAQVNTAATTKNVVAKELDFAVLPPATKRGRGMCPGEGCTYSYPCRRKPNVCPQCGVFLGGSATGTCKDSSTVAHAKKLKSGNLSSEYDFYSVKIARRGRDYRCFVQVSKNDSNHICFYEKCRIQRSTSMLSNSTGFACEHVKASKESELEAEPIPLATPALDSLPFSSVMKEEFLRLVQKADELSIPVVQQVSQFNFVVICVQNSRNPLGLLHLKLDKNDTKFTCGEDGSRSCVKPYRSKCVHYGLYKWATISNSPPPMSTLDAMPIYGNEQCSSSQEESHITATTSKAIQRSSTIRLLRDVVRIPEDASALAPIFKLIECKNAGTTTLLNSMYNELRIDLHCNEFAWKMQFEPEGDLCKLCGGKLSEKRQVQGSNGEGWLVTMAHVLPITCLIKKCMNPECMAIHGFHDVRSGLFNVSNKVMVSLDILFLIREHVKQGVAPLQAAEAIMSMTLVKNPTASAKMTIEKRRYIEQHLYRGYWAYECLTVRNADDAICGLCGVAPKVEFAESCPKDCISLSGIKIKWPESPPLSEDPVDVDGFWAEMENKTLEQVAFATVDMITSFDGARVAPYIPPSQRADKVINTESLKATSRSSLQATVQSFQGSSAKLAALIQQGSLVPGQLAQYTHSQLFTLCQRCEIPVNTTDNKALLQSYLEVGCQFLSAGKSSCHTFTGGASSSGGRLTKTCPHQVVTGSKFLLRQESARDHVDLLQACRYWPPVYIADAACSVTQHVSFRYPSLANQLWGDSLGCFQVPDHYREPQEVSCPELQMTELQTTPTPLVDPKDPLTHPATGMKQRRVLTPRIGDKGGSHHLKSCQYHNMDLCPELAAYKASPLSGSGSSRRHGTNPRDSRRKGGNNLTFHQYFLYGRLMDYFTSLEIVREQLELVSKQCGAGETIVRDKFQRFVIVCAKCFYGGHVAKDCPYNNAR